jgi:hypothetical protein
LAERIAPQFKQDYAENGISGVIARTKACYAAAGDTTALRACMLYDAAGYHVDKDYNAALGSDMRIEFFSDDVYNQRMVPYSTIVFGGWNSAAQDFLRQANEIVAQATNG